MIQEKQEENLLANLLNLSNLLASNKPRFQFVMYESSGKHLLFSDITFIDFGAEFLEALQEIGRELILELVRLKAEVKENTFLSFTSKKLFEESHIFLVKNRFLVQIDMMKNENSYKITITEI